MNGVRIETQRLLLRDFARSDEAETLAFTGDEQVVRYLPWRPHDESVCRAFLELASRERLNSPRLSYELAMELKQSKRVIGAMSIYQHFASQRSGQIGYLIHRDYWRQGFASEGLVALLSFVFNRLRFSFVEAVCDADNVGSMKVLERVGMRCAGQFEEHLLNGPGHWRPASVYRLAAADFRERAAQQR